MDIFEVGQTYKAYTFGGKIYDVKILSREGNQVRVLYKSKEKRFVIQTGDKSEYIKIDARHGTVLAAGDKAKIIYEERDSGYELVSGLAEEIVSEINPQYKVTAQDVENIMTTALEGGINHWATVSLPLTTWVTKQDGMPISQFVTQLLLDGRYIELCDIEDEDGPWLLTLNRLIQGIQLNAEHRQHDCDLEDFDANTADCIIQYALFDKVVYG